MEHFYLVWEPLGGYTRHRHNNRQEAEYEAVRLAKENPGKEFYVLRALSMSKKEEPVKTIELTDLPF